MTNLPINCPGYGFVITPIYVWQPPKLNYSTGNSFLKKNGLVNEE